MPKKAKQYSATEKTKIILEIIKAELTIAQISSNYGVHATQIQAWKKRGIENLVSGFQIKPQSKDPDNQDLIKHFTLCFYRTYSYSAEGNLLEV